MIDAYMTVLQYLPFLLKGLMYTAILSLVGMFAGTLVGVVSALALLSPFRIVRALATVYLDIFRSTPVLVQLIWFYYALPVLTGFSMPPLMTGCLVLSLYSGAFHTETFRSGILSIEAGQNEAGMALGMRSWQIMLRIILPQATVRMLPAYASTLVILVKESALASAISVPELLRQGAAVASFTFLTFQSLTVVAVIYFLVTFPISRFVNWLHDRLRL